MGGSSKGDTAPTTSDAVKEVVPAYLKNAVAAQMPAFMPGQQDLMSKQLSAGFGASPKAFADYLSKIYQPAQTMNYGAAPVTKPGAKPLMPVAKTGGGAASNQGQVVVNGKWTPVTNGQVFANGQWVKVNNGQAFLNGKMEKVYGGNSR